jgi:hypothetical protein
MTTQKSATGKSSKSRHTAITGVIIEKTSKGMTPSQIEVKKSLETVPVTPAACVRALEKAIGFAKSALHLEVAVALAMFASSDAGVDKEVKRKIMEVYTQAGFSTSPTGSDYKTVNRRINASAALYVKMGRHAVLSAMGGLHEGKAIDSLREFLADEFNFNGINAVLAVAGKPVKQTNTPEQALIRAAKVGQATTVTPKAGEETAMAATVGERIAQRRAEDAGMVVIATANLHVAIPRTTTKTEVQELAMLLMDFAAHMDFEKELAEAVDARNVRQHH